jgi:hypothetical protein
MFIRTPILKTLISANIRQHWNCKMTIILVVIFITIITLSTDRRQTTCQIKLLISEDLQ